MSPEQRKDFETEWPELARRLRRLLLRRGMGEAQADDVVQETGLRLFGSWEKVDRSRPAWPLTRTIALNHLRDQARRKFEEVAVEVPEIPHHHDVETAGMARVELHLVRDALRELSPAARAALLVEVGDGNHPLRAATDAEKMQRMRARRKLREMIGRVPVVLPFRFGKIGEFGQWLLGRGALAEGLGCVACVAIGVGAVAPVVLAPTPSSARPLVTEVVTFDPTNANLAGGSGSEVVSGVADIELASEAVRSLEGSSRRAERSRSKTKASQSAAEGDDLIPAPPGVPAGPDGVPTGPEGLPGDGYGSDDQVKVGLGSTEEDEGRGALPPGVEELQGEIDELAGGL